MIYPELCTLQFFVITFINATFSKIKSYYYCNIYFHQKSHPYATHFLKNHSYIFRTYLVLLISKIANNLPNQHVSTINTNQEAKVELQSQSMKSLNFRKQNLILVRFRCRCYTLSHFEYFMLNE